MNLFHDAHNLTSSLRTSLNPVLPPPKAVLNVTAPCCQNNYHSVQDCCPVQPATEIGGGAMRCERVVEQLKVRTGVGFRVANVRLKSLKAICSPNHIGKRLQSVIGFPPNKGGTLNCCRNNDKPEPESKHRLKEVVC